MMAQTNRSILLIVITTAVLIVAGALAPLAVHAQSASVTLQNFSFQPSTMMVPVGTTVTWTNMDNVAHTSTSDNGAWDSGPINTGASYHHTFTTAGTFTYHCTFHPYMHGTIVVGVSTPHAGGSQPATVYPSGTGHPAVTVTPSAVTVGMTAVVQGTRFTSNNWAFAYWQRPDGTWHGMWVFTSPAGLFSFRLGFNPRHGTGTEFVTAFDFGSRTWAPFATVSVTAGVAHLAGQLVASPNPVMNGRTTTIVGSGFTPNTRVFVEWRRPNGSMAAVWAFANSGGSFAFTLLADPRLGCGPRTFIAFDRTMQAQTAPYVLDETC